MVLLLSKHLSVIFSLVVCVAIRTTADVIQGGGSDVFPIAPATATNPSSALKAATAPPVRLDLSGSMNIHVLGPSALIIESPTPPIFDAPWRWCSVFCGARYKRRRLTHLKSTLRWYPPLSFSQLKQQRGVPSHCDVTREQSVARSKHRSRTRLQWHWKQQKAWWQWQWTSDLATTANNISVISSSAYCSTLISVPLGNQRFRYECQVSTAARRPSTAALQQPTASWWSPDVSINAQGQLEASNWSIFGDSRRMRLFVALRRKWLSNSSGDNSGQPLRAIVRFDSPYGNRSHLRWTTTIGDCTRPLETFKTSLRHEIMVGVPVVTAQPSSPIPAE